MLKDKDAEQTISVMSTLVSKFIIVQPENPRAMDKFELSELIKKFNGDYEVARDLPHACELSISLLDDNAALLVFGSLYLASQLRPLFKEKMK